MHESLKIAPEPPEIDFRVFFACLAHDGRTIKSDSGEAMAPEMSSPPLAPPPAPEVQKDMISEVMKLEMKQGQVCFENGLSASGEKGARAFSLSLFSNRNKEQPSLGCHSRSLAQKYLSRMGTMYCGVGPWAWKACVDCFSILARLGVRN